MLKKKIIVTVLSALMFNPVILPQNNFLPVSIACAEVQTIEADGYYTMGDGLEENQGVAKERAREDAKRAASEQACTFIETLSEIQNNQITRDEIRSISATVLKVINSEVKPEISGNSIMFHCHIIVTVDTSNITEKLLQNKRYLEAALHQIKEKDAEIAKLNSEIEQMKQQFKTASLKEKNEIKHEVKRNEKQFTAVQWNDKALEYYRARDYDQAIECFNKAVELNPNFYNALSNLGSLYNRIANYDKAVECLNKSIEINPNYDKSWNNLGSVYSKMRNYEKAIECFDKAIAINPNDFVAYYNLASAYYELGNNEKAIEYYTKATELNAKDARTWFMMGYVYYNLGEYSNALECFDRLVELRPNNAKYQQMRQDALEKMNKE